MGDALDISPTARPSAMNKPMTPEQRAKLAEGYPAGSKTPWNTVKPGMLMSPEKHARMAEDYAKPMPGLSRRQRSGGGSGE